MRNGLSTMDPALKLELEECDKIYNNICERIKEQADCIVDWQMLDKAWRTVKRLRPNTRRKSGELYVCHPCFVMEEVAGRNCKTSLLAAALLHDTIKDKNLTYEVIRTDFGCEVARIVSAVAAIKKSDTSVYAHYSNLSEELKKDIWDAHVKQELLNVPYLSEGLLIFFADRVDNLKSLSFCDQNKRQSCIESTRFVAIPAAKYENNEYFAELLSELCLAREQDECDRVYDNICKHARKQPGYTVDWQFVDRAWDTAKRLHGGTRRKSGELYIYHPCAVMGELVKLQRGSNILAAALLHDTMEDCSLTYEQLREDFSDKVAQIVSAVTAIKAEEREADPHYASMTPEEKHGYLDRLTDAKLIASSYQWEAFLVRFADRVHNLATIDACSTGKRLEKIASTRAFLIPAAHKLGMRYFEIVLSDYCMKFDGEEYKENESVGILEKRNALTTVSGSAYSRFDQILQDALETQNVFSFPKFNPFAKMRGFTSNSGEEEMHATLRRVLLAHELKQQLDQVVYFERSRLDLWEVILTYKDRSTHNMLENFLELYRTRLKGEGIFFEYIGQERDATVIRLSDKFENNYRIVLIPESKLVSHFIGNPRDERLTMADEDAPGDALRPQITVYSYSPQKGYREFSKCVPFGATALDFAFMVSPALAVTVNHAKIHKWRGGDPPSFRDNDYAYPLRTVLSDGDVVHFNADYHPRISGVESKDKKVSIPHATIDWFAYVNTELAKNCLIRYFKDKYPN